MLLSVIARVKVCVSSEKIPLFHFGTFRTVS